MSDEIVTIENGVVCLKLAIDSDGRVMTLEIIDNTDKNSLASQLLGPLALGISVIMEEDPDILYTAGTELYDGEYIDMDDATRH
jgi:hypothetical protein